jgi:hypothetical protein
VNVESSVRDALDDIIPAVFDGVAVEVRSVRAMRAF